MSTYGTATPIRTRRTAGEILSGLFLRCAVAGGVLGLVGYALRASAWEDPTLGNILVDLSDTVYRTIRLFLFVSEFPRNLDDASLRWTVSTALLHAARFLAPISFYGMLSRALFNLLRPQLQRRRLQRLRGHTILCGLSEIGRQFALNLLRNDPTSAHIVAIENRNVEAARAFAGPLGIELLEGSPREAQSLLRAGVKDAARIVLTTDDDSANLDAAALLPALVEGRSLEAPLEAHMEVRNDTLLNELTNRDAFLRPSERLELRPFNIDVLVARRFFAEHNLMAEAELRDQRRVHLLLIGFDSVALQIVLQLARIAPYRDFLRPAVTVLTARPDGCRETLSTSYPELAAESEGEDDKVIALRLERWAAELDGLSPSLMRAVEADDEITAIVVCLGEDSLNARTALLVRSHSQREARWRAPIYLHQRGIGGFGRFVQAGITAKEFVEVIEPFGMLEGICRLEDLSGEADLVAQRLHEGYLTLKGTGLAAEPRPSLKPWRQLDEIYRRANRRAADHIPVKLASAGFRVTGFPLMRQRGKLLSLEAEALRDLARLEHESWMNGQKLAGWRRGAPRDDRRRYHEYLVPFEALERPIRDYDVEQVRLVVEKLVGEADDDKVTVRRERRIGLIAEPGLSEEETAEALRAFNERTLPMILERFADDWLTFMTRMRPGAEILMCESVAAALSARAHRAWRLIVIEAEPPQIAFHGDGPRASAPDGDMALADMLARRAALIALPETDWRIDLTPPALRLEDWLKDPTLRERANARAQDYLTRKCEVLIAAEGAAAAAAARPAMGLVGSRGAAGDRLIRLPAG